MSSRQRHKLPPTTVRFTPELHDFIAAEGRTHPLKKSGVINDAVKAFSEMSEKRRRKLRRAQ